MPTATAMEVATTLIIKKIRGEDESVTRKNRGQRTLVGLLQNAVAREIKETKTSKSSKAYKGIYTHNLS